MIKNGSDRRATRARWLAVIAFICCVTLGAAHAHAGAVWLNDEIVAGSPKDLVEDAIGTSDFLVPTLAADKPTLSTDTPFSYGGNHSLSFTNSNDRLYRSNTVGTPLEVRDALTIEAWIKAGDNTDPVAPSYRLILGQFDTYCLLIMNDTVNPPGYGFIYYQGIRRGVTYTAAGSAILSDGEWHHMAATFDSVSNEVILYVDGVQDKVQSAAGTGPLDYTDRAFMMGDDGSGRHFNGLIDEARVSNMALSPDQLGAHASLLPEPSTLLLAAVALGCTAFLRRRRR